MKLIFLEPFQKIQDCSSFNSLFLKVFISSASVQVTKFKSNVHVQEPQVVFRRYQETLGHKAGDKKAVRAPRLPGDPGQAGQ